MLARGRRLRERGADTLEQVRFAGARRAVDQQRRVGARLGGRNLGRLVRHAVRVAGDERVEARQRAAWSEVERRRTGRLVRRGLCGHRLAMVPVRVRLGSHGRGHGRGALGNAKLE